jgi:thymidine kinase
MIINYITGTMGSGKSEQLIEDILYYPNAIAITVALERAPRLGNVTSRSGKSTPALVLNVEQSEAEVLACLSIYIEKVGLTEYLLIDEAQFLNSEQINAIENAAIITGIKGIIFYGLMTDFTGRTFAGSEWIMNICDNVFVIPAECQLEGCENDATHNGRFVDGKLITEGQQLVAEKTMYRALCSSHFLKLQQ